MKQLKKEYPVVLSQDIIWGDMDAFGHINNTVYFRYFEDARIAYFDQIGVHEQMKQIGDGLIVYYDYANGKSCEIPSEIVTAIKKLEELHIPAHHEHPFWSNVNTCSGLT